MEMGGWTKIGGWMERSRWRWLDGDEWVEVDGKGWDDEEGCVVRWRMFDSCGTWGIELYEFAAASGEVSGRETSPSATSSAPKHTHICRALSDVRPLVFGVLCSEELLFRVPHLMPSQTLAYAIGMPVRLGRLVKAP